MDNLSKLYSVLADTLEVDVNSITSSSSPDTIKAWDSLGMVNLIGELEQAFQVSFDILEISEMHNVDIIMSILADKGVSFD